VARGYKGNQVRVPALVFPEHLLNGWEPTFHIKPDNPRVDEVRPDGTVKYQKYDRPVGSANRLDVPPTVRDKVMDYNEPLVFTEGWKKGDAAASHGMAVVALGGTWNYAGRTEDGWMAPLEDLRHIPLKMRGEKGRRVLIVFDSDVRINQNVRAARERFYHLLMGYGARVQYVDFEPLPDGGKCGLDDFLLTHTVKELWALAYDPAEREVTRLRAELAEERRNRSATLYALRNPKIKAERVALVATVNYLEMKHAYDQTPPVELPGKGGGWHDVPRAAIAEQAGCGEKTAGGHMDSGAQWGLYEKTLDWDPRRHVDDDGVIVDGPKRIFMRRMRPASESLALIATLDPPKGADKDTWGGPREVTCPDHPKAGTVKKWVLHCQECDRALDSGETPQRPKYHDDTPPDEHAEELVDALPTPVGQDDPCPPTGHLDPPGIEGATYDPPATPMGQDDLYPPAHPIYAPVADPPAYEPGYLESLTGTAQTPPKLEPLACHSTIGECSQQAFCARQGRCRWSPLAPTPATTTNHNGGGL
jgi:hypothetical protein